MNDDANLFARALSELDATQQTLAESAHQPRATGIESSELRDDLHIVQAMRHLHLPADELYNARARVAERLRREMAATSDATVPDGVARIEPSRLGTTTAPRRPTRMRRLARFALAAAALLLIGCVAGWQVSDAAASALPGSPLYGIKRGEEQLALDFAQSDQRRGAVLATIADHRLTELRAEALQHNTSLVQSLAGEFDDTMHRLIALTATMSARHENTTLVSADLAHELNAEYSTLHTALQNGDVLLAQALTTTTQAESAAIHNSHITLPPSADSTAYPGLGTPGSTPAGGPPATVGPPGGIPTHTPPIGPGNGNGNGNGGGNGGQGEGTPGTGGGGHGDHTSTSGSPGTQPFTPSPPPTDGNTAP